MKLRNNQAFTLLEVMVAMAILAMAVTTLLVVRNNSIDQAARAIEIRLIRTLLEQKTGEIASGIEKGSSGVFAREGYPEYAWHSHISKTRLKSSADTEGKVHEAVLNKITVRVDKPRSIEKHSQTIVLYLLAEKPEDAEKEKK